MEHLPRLWPTRVIWFLLLAAVGCAADLWTKHVVFASSELYHGSEWWLVEGHIGLPKESQRGGPVWHGPRGKCGCLERISLVAVVAIPVWLFYFRAAESFWLTTALGCVLGGGPGRSLRSNGFLGADLGCV